MTQQPSTFIGWIESYYGEKLNSRPVRTIAYSLDDPDDLSKLLEVEPQTVFENGDYSMDNPKMFRAIELMGKDMKKIADQQGIDLSKFEDLKAAFGYDMDPNNISAAELGSYVVGVFMTDSTFKEHQGVIKSILEESEVIPGRYHYSSYPEKVELAQELGQQVFGDNKPENSSTDTSNEKSMERVDGILPNPR